MSVMQSVSDKIRSLRDFWDERQSRKDRQALMKKRRFKVAPASEELGEHEEAVRQVDRFKHSGRLEGCEPLFRAAHAASHLLPGGMLVHQQMKFRLIGEAPEKPDSQRTYLAPFHAAFDRAPSPFTAALLGEALAQCAHASRGSAWVDETSEEQWAAQDAHSYKARSILDACPDSDGTCPFWQRANYRVVIEDAASRGEVDRAFEQAWAVDRDNLTLCADYGIMMLPRWWGEGPQDLEVFARRAIAMTENRFGAGAYAFIYATQAEIGSHEVGDTLCDRDLLDRAFQDLTVRFPDSQSLLNRQITTLDWLEDYDTIYRLQKRLTTINPDIWHWYLGGEDCSVDDALDTLLVAREVAVGKRLDDAF